ncbi:MAG: hypothetical protein IJS60_04585 [Abditibacteriota bacterium]|nr:hypothetical protein [Abditibacteriota bacterium]
MYFVLILFLIIFSVSAFAQDKINYSGAVWDRNGHGNHRAVVEVTDSSDYNKVRIIWRRRDPFPENINIVLEDSKGNEIKDYYEIEKNRIYCDLIFNPTAGSGLYYIYYMPFIPVSAYEKENEYFNERNKWGFYNIGPTKVKDNLYRDYPKAKHIAIQYRETPDTPGRNSFYPMEIVASADEVRELTKAHPDNILVFPEDREHPIKMFDFLPYRWIEQGPSLFGAFTGAPNEYLVFQLGIYALKSNINNIKAQISDFISEGETIFKDRFTCFNLEGINHEGNYFTKRVDIEKKKVQPLWFGLDIPRDAKGEYKGTITLTSENTDPVTVNLIINVQGGIKEDKGYDDMFTLARLNWLNSDIGFDDIVLPPYTPVEVKENKINILDREITLSDTGLPKSLISRGFEILANPIKFNINSNINSPIKTKSFNITDQGQSFVDYNAKYTDAGFSVTTDTTVECEGVVTVSLKLKAIETVSAEDIFLEIPIKKEIAQYMIGYGHQGGFRKTDIRWKWNINKIDYRFWTGNTNAGIHLDLRDNIDTWDMYYNYNYGNPKSWDNEGLGGADVIDKGDYVLIKAYSGERDFKKGEEIEFNFRLHITPFHKIDPKHWSYTSSYSGKIESANYYHQHHADVGYEYINYPFYNLDKLNDKFKKTNEKLSAINKNYKGVELYYTLRELTTYCPELFAFESLNYEIYENGNNLKGSQKEVLLNLHGGKEAWVREHMSIEPHTEWRSNLNNGELDPAISTLGCSRLSNFYIKGLEYILDNLPIHGIYIDSLKYSRTTMKRLAKTLYKKRGVAHINMHTYNFFDHFDAKCSPLSNYMEHLPYVTYLWLGEEANYDRKPDHWLVELSGIPFGLTSEELLFGNTLNQYRGMIFAMGSKEYPNAADLWKFWEDYKIDETEMIGYWDNCPIKTDCEDVYCTCYKKEKECLVAVASWSDKDENITLNIDFDKLGIDKNKATITIPPIQGYQEAGSFEIFDKITIPKEGGYLMVIK